MVETSTAVGTELLYKGYALEPSQCGHFIGVAVIEGYNWVRKLVIQVGLVLGLVGKIK